MSEVRSRKASQVRPDAKYESVVLSLPCRVVPGIALLLSRRPSFVNYERTPRRHLHTTLKAAFLEDTANVWSSAVVRQVWSFQMFCIYDYTVVESRDHG